MNILEKTDRLTVKTENGLCGIKMKYPVFENCKNAKKLNLFFEKAKTSYVQYAKKNAVGGEIFSFDTSSVYHSDDVCSFFFEKSVKKGRYITKYSPFSLTFCQKSGKVISLLSVCPSCADFYTEVRKIAKAYGVKLSFSQFSRRFYVCGDGIVIYFSVFRPEIDVRQSCECVKKIYLSEGSIPSFSSIVRK